jgi:magnesium transporter
MREAITVVLLAAVLGILGFLLSFMLYSSIQLSSVVSASIFIAAIIAAAIAIALPLVFYKLNFDPAIPSGPFATVLSDITSVFVYFIIASFMMKQFL